MSKHFLLNVGRVSHLSQQAQLRLWTVFIVLATLSAQAQAKNKVTQMICDFKNYFFEGALVWAIFGLSVVGAVVWWMLDDDSKVKGKILGLIVAAILIAAVPEIIQRFGGEAC